jgi:chemotaxis protein CheD
MSECDPRTGPIFLQPAQMVVAEAAMRVRTVLGSCVAIIMRAPRLGVAAMAHCLLPSAGAAAGDETLKYVDATIDRMILVFARRGAGSAELEVKLFGGADSMQNSTAGSPYRVGSRNVESALRELAALGIVPASSDVGGVWARLIELDTGTGDVFVKRLPGMPHRLPGGSR